MDTIVPESWITLDTRLLGKNIVILALEIATISPKLHNSLSVTVH